MKIIIFKSSKNSYLRDYLFDEKALILSSFLTDDVGLRENPYKNFIDNPKEKATSSNYSFLIKYEADVFISCQFDEDPYENCLQMPQKEFIFLVDQWLNLIKQDPQEIVVYKEGESYRLEGRGFPDNQE